MQGRRAQPADRHEVREKRKNSVSVGGFFIVIFVCLFVCLFVCFILITIIHSCSMGSIKARQLFPRLLQLVGEGKAVVDEFVAQYRNVPLWMFLGWVAQIVAILDKQEGEAILGLIAEIGEQYVEALNMGIPFFLPLSFFFFSNACLIYYFYILVAIRSRCVSRCL